MTEKFRAFDNVNKKWLDRFLITQDGRVLVSIKQSGWQNFTDVVVDATLCRSTGLKDKNGVMIFENDIIKLYDEVYKIKFESGNFYMVRPKDGFCKILCHYLEEIEIIGNTLDHKHLLEGKQ